MTVQLIVAVVFALVGLVCVFSVALGLPGLWVLLGLGVAVELADGLWLETPRSFGWWALLAVLGIAVLGELVEAGASLLGVKQGGGTRHGAIGSFIGALVGGISCSFLIPIPVVGTLIGVLGGTFLGALIGELSHPKSKGTKEAMKPAFWATVARVVGTAVKTLLSFGAWIVLVLASLWPLWDRIWPS